MRSPPSYLARPLVSRSSACADARHCSDRRAARRVAAVAAVVRVLPDTSWAGDAMWITGMRQDPIGASKHYLLQAAVVLRNAMPALYKPQDQPLAMLS